MVLQFFHVLFQLGSILNIQFYAFTHISCFLILLHLFLNIHMEMLLSYLLDLEIHFLLVSDHFLEELRVVPSRFALLTHISDGFSLPGLWLSLRDLRMETYVLHFFTVLDLLNLLNYTQYFKFLITYLRTWYSFPLLINLSYTGDVSMLWLRFVEHS